jgi:4-cresol dehydrogenase (hydroxylating)
MQYRRLDEDVLTAWRDALGADNVVTETRSLRAAETGTFASTHAITAIIRPADRGEVEECLRIANRFSTPVYPISSGRNWGYGSRIPSADGCALMDLGRMNRIVDFSESLAYVTVEPGVTQAQLHAFLEEHGSKLWMDATGASPHCSLIGNTVDRGFGHTPYGDHFAHVCGLEVVLPTGDVVETGFARFPSAAAAPVYNWGVGPALDGIFSQSNFGVVTRMTIWLMPKPEYFQAYYFRCEEAGDLEGAIDALRPLRLDGTIRSASHIANDYKVVSALRQYPWQETGGQTPLRGEVMAELRRDLKIGAWNGSGALYGTKRQVAEARRLLRKALHGRAQRLQFLDDDKLRLASLFAKPYQWISGWNLDKMLAVLKPVYGLMKGIPTDHPLESTYWRKRTAPTRDMDPDRDGCGLIWCSPVAPNDGAAASHLTRMVSELVLAHGFEPAISLTMISGRALASVISLTYDRDLPGEDQKAKNCYRELVSSLAEHGYHSYRMASGMMAGMGESGPYTELLAGIKRAVDPSGILAPGRYVRDTREVRAKAAVTAQ